MTRHNKDIGQRGEREAIIFLQQKGYKVIEQNYSSRWGEIDIIAEKNNKLTFFEVKTRQNDSFGKPYESVDFRKLKNLKRAIQYYLLQKSYKNYKLSLDVISIFLDSSNEVKKLSHFENVATY